MNVTNPNVVANGTNTGMLPTMKNAYTAFEILKRAIPYMVTEKWGQAYVLPTNSTRVAKWRRYEALDPAMNALTEGVTPASQDITVTDISVPLVQYGTVVTLSDVLVDTDDSQVLQQTAITVGEQAAETIERLRLGVLLAGTNVEYSNGTARSDVNTPINLAMQRRVTRKLRAQKAREHTEAIMSTPNFNTENVAASFVAIVHPNLDADIRSMPGFIDVKDYGGMKGMENEIGSVEGVRYFYTTLLEPWQDAGGLATGGGGSLPAVLSTSGTNADVYPVLYLGRDSYGLVPFKGMSAITPTIVNATPSDSDPLAQRSHVSWKSMQAAVILNQAWMVRGEVAVSQL